MSGKTADELIVEANTTHIPLWLVWVQDPEGTSLRAIDTKFEYAKAHKGALQQEAEDWGKKRRVTIEEREANHMFGAGVLSRIFASRAEGGF